MFARLLNHLLRHFTVKQEIDHQNGFMVREMTDGLDTYKIEYYEGNAVTIIAPTKTHYYRSGQENFGK